jgi:predicted GNAT family N-acyltransferase
MDCAERLGYLSSMNIKFTHRPFDRLSLMELHDLLKLRVEVFVCVQGITQYSTLQQSDQSGWREGIIGLGAVRQRQQRG